ncbi:Uncharacterised protein [Vibrio cholerae]|uniref:Uncharacterized protein n=1 Tax=Vibrio cholerae TaxID=666 RepID=A0A655Z7G2_VIBCL|nr:Uncharacterised protein [Vibrio cholerae]
MLQSLNVLRFLVGQHLRYHLRDTELFGNRIGNRSVIASQHHGMNSKLIELSYRLR